MNVFKYVDSKKTKQFVNPINPSSYFFLENPLCCIIYTFFLYNSGKLLIYTIIVWKAEFHCTAIMKGEKISKCSNIWLVKIEYLTHLIYVNGSKVCGIYIGLDVCYFFAVANNGLFSANLHFFKMSVFRPHWVNLNI